MNIEILGNEYWDESQYLKHTTVHFENPPPAPASGGEHSAIFLAVSSFLAQFSPPLAGAGGGFLVNVQ